MTLCLEKNVVGCEARQGEDEARDSAREEQVQRMLDSRGRRPYWYTSPGCARDVDPVEDAGYEEGPKDDEDRVDILGEKRQARDDDVGDHEQHDRAQVEHCGCRVIMGESASAVVSLRTCVLAFDQTCG